jgi:serine/threonine protein kinase
MAPEIIKASGHGRQADIWSVGKFRLTSSSLNCLLDFFLDLLVERFCCECSGCTVIEMLTGRLPWCPPPTAANKNPAPQPAMTVMYQIANSDSLPYFPPDVSPECKDFITRCLQRFAFSQQQPIYLFFFLL